MLNRIYQTVSFAALPRIASDSYKTNEIIGIQCMRYFAALAVLIDHLIVAMCQAGKFPESWLPFAYKLGDAGVFLFFGISGFVMVLTGSKKFQQKGAPLKFFTRRFIRIWPMYFLATIIVFLMKYGSDPIYSFENLAKSISFIPYIGENDYYRPVLGKGWTLNYEMFFYVIFALCLALPKRLGLLAACMALIVLGCSDGVAQGVIWKFYANNIVLYFLVGILLGYAVNETRVQWLFSERAGSAVGMSLLVFLALIYFNFTASADWIKLVSMLVLILLCLYCVCFSGSRFKSESLTRLMSLLGDASYSLYLFHGFFFFGLRSVFQKIDNSLAIGMLPLVIVAVTYGCVIIHLYIEKPLTRVLMK